MADGRIYVGTYAKYNNGSIKGKWFDLSDYADKEDFIEAAQRFHKDERDPELMFQDWENIPNAFVNESYIAPEFWDYMDQLQDVDSEAFETFFEYHGYRSDDLSDAIKDFEDSFEGEYASELDFVYDYIDAIGGENEVHNKEAFFDSEKYARDLKAEGWIEVTHTEANDDPDEYPDGAGVYDDQMNYMGDYNSIEDLVDDWFENGDLDAEIERYFDYEKFARDLFLDTFVWYNKYVWRRF